ALWNGDEQYHVPLQSTQELMHYGTPRHSGRYPWGSGKNPYQGYRDFMSLVDDLRRQGLTPTQIAEGFEMKTPELRARVTIARNAIKKEHLNQVIKLKAKGTANTTIAKKIGMSEAYVRTLLAPTAKDRSDKLNGTVENLKAEIAAKKY